MHAARRYNVFAQGITLSHGQAAVAEQRLQQAHLTQSSGIEFLDYRLAPKQFTGLDKIASVGMFEHVGLRNLRQYFRTVYDLLKPGGIFLNHGIARAWEPDGDDHELPLHPVSGEKKRKNVSFIDKYVFPDGELVTLAQAVQAAESAGFEVRDVENLREHYEQTLRRWTEALQDHAQEALQYVSERVYRIWLLYMAGCAAAFRRGDIALYQILLSKPDHGRNSLPLTREDWYKNTEDWERRAA
ncbi:MAG: class I SAM-dependent methyltransferase [Acidobacteria bacterium]|nr:class I SAM-dependent methyltransferase [Acidobacteriota bacterium]